jgi:transposase
LTTIGASHRQEAVERRYSAFKGPLAVAALFLKNNRRIAALVTVICLALLIFCLIERQVRQSLTEQGQTKVKDLYAGRTRSPPAGSSSTPSPP